MKNARWIGLLLGIMALAGALAPAAPQEANKGLAQQQLKLARQALSDLDRMYKGGEAAIYDPRFALWERRQVEAIHASGATQAEFMTALESYVKRMKALEQLTEQGFAKDQ